MSIVIRMRKGYAVYWAVSAANAYGGHSYVAPVEIRCRWDDEQSMVRDNEGNEVVSSATVYVDRDLTFAVDGWGYLYKGRLSSISGDNTDPTAIETARRILTYGEIESLKYTPKKKLRIVKLT